MITGIYERNGKIYVRTTYRGIPIYKTFAGNTTRYQKQADKFLREAKYLIDNGEYCTERKTLEQAYLDMDKTLRTSGRKKEQSKEEGGRELKEEFVEERQKNNM